MRNPESLFNAVVNFINNVPVGSTYRSSDLCQHTTGIEEITWWKSRNNNPSYRTRTYQSYLHRTGFVQNISYGVWKVVKHIPEWLDLGHLNNILGYTKWDYEKNENVLQYDGMTREQMKQRLEMESQAVNEPEYRGPLDEAITTFDTVDPLKACIDLRRMGVLAVPVDECTIEVHAMHKSCGSDLAQWMYDNGFELDEYPELDHYIAAYWPEQEEDNDHDCDCDKVFVVVLDYTNGKTYIHQGIDEDFVEALIEDEYCGCTIEWMTMDKLNLEII